MLWTRFVQRFLIPIHVGVVFVVLGASPAEAQVETSTSPASSATVAQPPQPDGRLDELIVRQRELEEQLRAQARQIRTLQGTVALPLHAPSSTSAAFLAVGSRDVSPDDPELLVPLAGYSDKNFFLRDRHSWFVLVPKGRINVDLYEFPKRPDVPGVVSNSAADQRPRDTLFIRRARLGLAGTLVRHIDFRVEADFASVPTPGQYATVTDASVNINYSRYLQLEAGQFYTPFTLENPTSENYTDFMEKAAAVRFVVPTSRETGAMLHGQIPWSLGRYWVGLFDGDGQNFKNLDNKPAVIGRGFITPLWPLEGHAKWMEDVWLGGSFWYQRADNLGGVGPPALSGPTSGDLSSFTTQGGISYFSSNYANGTDAMKNAIRTHLAPDGKIAKWALELNLPIGRRFGLRGEYMSQSIDLRRYDDVNPGNGNLKRTSGTAGNLKGWAAYGEAYAWIGRPPNVDKPGLYQTPHWNGYVPPKPPRWAVMLAARYEHVSFGVSGLNDVAGGRYTLDSLSLGTSLWVTRHSRLMANYVLNYLGSGEGPAAINETKNLYYQRLEHEVLFRLAVSL
jgi:hypothetical protein